MNLILKAVRRLSLRLAIALVTSLSLAPVAQAQDASFDDWAVIVMAADWRDSGGQPIEAFENARQDLAAGFAQMGFNADNITSLTLRPNKDGSALTSRQAFDAIAAQTRAARGGCLLYFTSHGSAAGILMGQEGLLPPARLAQLVDHWCGNRPTVAIISACFSGVFLPVLAGENRMVVTAARFDRSSFGCGADAQYPYFDGCVIESMPDAVDFLDLATRARTCVARREREENLRPPSSPQTRTGAMIRPLLARLPFDRGPP